VITLQHVKERLSIAFIHALTGGAGISIEGHRPHDYGVDFTLRQVVKRGDRYVESGIALDLQLKATTAWHHEGESVIYDLESKNFNDIVTRDPAAIPLVIGLFLPS